MYPDTQIIHILQSISPQQVAKSSLLQKEIWNLQERLTSSGLQFLDLSLERRRRQQRSWSAPTTECVAEEASLASPVAALHNSLEDSEDTSDNQDSLLSSPVHPGSSPASSCNSLLDHYSNNIDRLQATSNYPPARASTVPPDPSLSVHPAMKRHSSFHRSEPPGKRTRLLLQGDDRWEPDSGQAPFELECASRQNQGDENDNDDENTVASDTIDSNMVTNVECHETDYRNFKGCNNFEDGSESIDHDQEDNSRDIETENHSDDQANDESYEDTSTDIDRDIENDEDVNNCMDIDADSEAEENDASSNVNNSTTGVNIESSTLGDDNDDDDDNNGDNSDRHSNTNEAYNDQSQSPSSLGPTQHVPHQPVDIPPSQQSGLLPLASYSKNVSKAIEALQNILSKAQDLPTRVWAASTILSRSDGTRQDRIRVLVDAMKTVDRNDYRLQCAKRFLSIIVLNEIEISSEATLKDILPSKLIQWKRSGRNYMEAIRIIGPGALFLLGKSTTRLYVAVSTDHSKIFANPIG